MKRKPPKRNTCACGKLCWYDPYSTIQDTQCPNCKLKNLLSGDTKAVKQGLYSKHPTKRTQKLKKSPKMLAMENADLWFSRYIRIKYAYKIQNGEVYCQCIVERSVIKLAKNIDNGHCFSRGNKPTRYFEDNCRPQNRSSNRWKGEEHHYIFIDHLKEEIGEERFNNVDKLRREDGQDNIVYYKEQSTKYRKLVNQLVKKHDIIKWWQRK